MNEAETRAELSRAATCKDYLQVRTEGFWKRTTIREFRIVRQDGTREVKAKWQLVLLNSSTRTRERNTHERSGVARRKNFLKVQILDVERLKEMAGDHPLMSIALAERVQELREKLSVLPPEAETIETPAV